MADELTKALLLEEVVSPSAVADALFASVTGGVPLVQALVDAGAATPDTIHRYLSRVEAPFLRQIFPVAELVERLPPGMCARLFAVPVRHDAITGTVDVAVADVSDGHAAAELSFHLRAPVRVVRAHVTVLDEAVRRIRMQSLPPPVARTNPSYPPPPAPFSPQVPQVPPQVLPPSSRRGPYVSDAPPHVSPNARLELSPESRTEPSYPAPPQLAPPSDNEPLYDSRPRSIPASSRRMNTLPPPVFERAPSATIATAPQERSPISVPPASPGLAGAVRRRRDTPTWGTPVHSSSTPKKESEAPPPNLGSEIPIPLTRKTFMVERGGTQRPPPPMQPGVDAQLGEGIPVDPASYRTIVEVRAPDYSPESRPNPGHPGDASFIPGPPPMPAGGTFAAYAPQVQQVHYADVGGILASLRIAQTRDEILELTLTGARMLALKVALFVVKRGGYLGWACTPELADRVAIQNLLIPLESGSIFDLAVQEGLYLGPIRQDRVHMGLLHVMKGASRDVAAVPIRVAGKTAVLILADDLGDTMIGTRRLEEIARAAGDAFARIVKTRR